jgi:hypothetical protein
MGKGIAANNDRIENIIDGTAEAVTVAETGTAWTDTAAATGTEAGTETGGSTEKGKRPRKNRTVPVVVTPADPIPAPTAAPEKVKTRKPTKADPTIVAALVAVAGTGMTITGKLLHDERTWTPVGNELQQVAEPAARIIERFSATETVSKYADYVALGMAVAGIVIPRVLLTMNKPTGVKNDGKKKRNTNAETATPVLAAREAGKETPKVNPADAASDGLKSSLTLGD